MAGRPGGGSLDVIGDARVEVFISLLAVGFARNPPQILGDPPHMCVLYCTHPLDSQWVVPMANRLDESAPQNFDLTYVSYSDQRWSGPLVRRIGSVSNVTCTFKVQQEGRFFASSKNKPSMQRSVELVPLHLSPPMASELCKWLPQKSHTQCTLECLTQQRGGDS